MTPLVCPHRPPCPGCPRLGSEVPPAALARLERLGRAHGIENVPFRRGDQMGFRHRARLAVRGRMRSPKVGIFRVGSHRVVDTPTCLVHHPLINEVARALRESMKETSTPPYADVPHQGVVRYLQVTVERSTRTAQVVVVTNDETPQRAEALLQSLQTRIGTSLHSLFWNGNPHRTNRILGERFERIVGPEAVRETIDGADVFYTPGAFMQSHIALSEDIARLARRWVPDTSRVAEFYAGTGALGLGLLHRAAVVFNEASPDSLESLAMGIKAQSPEHRERATLAPGLAGDNAHLAESADVVIVDPPRKGLDLALTERLCARPPGKLVYIACDVETFVRDATVLLAHGHLRLSHLEAFDLFPHTDHAETVALFEETGAT